MLAFWLVTLCFLSSTVAAWPLQDIFRRQTATAPTKFMFIFGDSYTATGFSMSGTQPSVSNPLGNPPVPGIRLSGGDMWVDTVMKSYARNGTVAYDFAVAQNTVNSSRVQNPNPPTPNGDFRGQLALFESTIGAAASSKLKWKAANTLFINWFGINDIVIQAFQGRNGSTAQAILGPDVADYFGRLERQWQLGGRNFITILVPPISKIGAFGWGTGPDAANVAALTQYWNAQMQSANSQFQKLHPYASSRIVDPTATFNTILSNPQQYGAPNATCWSFPEGQPCLWHDFGHPGIVIQTAFGKQMGSLIQSIGF
ncbi:uncharacterized protein RCC_08418 [Ramularia collo-cygni]|uniref:Cellulose-binding GDSL lipase/acylhydrolase n=1 Tax=Ramularia collo-cygni TaxID=112498 RepID=A0A2D3V416_9PEZI|nr:uncharacterized protein RCC_08418 [Ramularia collo-cygni]CZT22713.1 uncharacterized protein RCC_08418 [Ramularia collo-cygni]